METIKAEDVFFEICDLTNEPLYEGFYVNGGTFHLADSERSQQFICDYALALGLDYANLDESYDDGFHYYTSFSYQYQDLNTVEFFYDYQGILYYKEELENFFINSQTEERYILLH